MKKILLALLTGLLLAFSWPTYGFPLLLFVAFVPLLYVEFHIRAKGEKRGGVRVFGLAYLSFFAWNIITTYWLYNATPFGMWFAVLANSLLMTLVFLIYHKIARRINFVAASTFLVTLWICFEKLHLNWEFSWPWLNLGNGFSEYIKWIQWYEYTGTFGGTLWVWIVNLSIFRALLLYQQHRDKGIIYRGLLKNSLLIVIPIGISLVIWYTYPSEESQPKLNTVILQPNINPYTEKYNTNDTRIGKLLNELAAEKVTDSTQLIVAPETVFADGTRLNHFKDSPAHHATITMLLKHPKVNILGGISFLKWITHKDQTTPQSNFYRENLWYNDYNSAFLINGTEADQLYHKSKLVVGVENFPYQSLLKPILGDAMIDLGGTVALKTTQPDREVFTLNSGEKAAPIICYESVYGEYVTGYVKNGAQFLTIITNDAWWGDTQGHKQHFSYARLRSIETRRDIARSANTGISGFFNQRGEVVSSLGYEKKGSLSGVVHLNTAETFYVKFGDYIARISEFLALFIFLFAVFRKRKTIVVRS